MPPTRVLAVMSALAVVGLGAPPSSGVSPGGFVSANVTWVATIPLDAPAISGKVVTVGGQRRFYVTGVKGLTIYDVTNPARPLPLGAIANPNWENESAAISADGSVVFLASDPAFQQPPVTYVLDTSLVTAPHVVGVITEGTHTTTCADSACNYLYGNYGWIYDVRDRAHPVRAGSFAGAVHYASRDAAGLLWADDQLIDPRTDPENPTVTTVGTGGWHGNLRPNAAQWSARSAGNTSMPLQPGELVIGGDETWLAPGTCTDASAGLSTWSVINFDKGTQAVQLDSITPVNGTYVDGNPTVDPVGCSSHWFDYRNGIVVAGWYDHGVRFVTVNEQTGDLAVSGFFQPVATEAWGAYWIDDEYVYTVDAVRGLDILRYDRSAPASPASPPSRNSQPLTPATRHEVYVCRPRAVTG